MSETTEAIDSNTSTKTEYFYVKKYKLVEHETLGFLKGKFVESQECTREEILNLYALPDNFLDEIKYLFEAATYEGLWIQIYPLKHIRIIK